MRMVFLPAVLVNVSTETCRNISALLKTYLLEEPQNIRLTEVFDEALSRRETEATSLLSPGRVVLGTNLAKEVSAA